MPLNVLIIEDNPVTRQFLNRVVRESFSDELTLSEVGTSEAALALLASHANQPDAAFQLILVDLELPNGQGMEVLQALAPAKAVKIATTLYSDDEHLFPALQCGADGYLLKEDRFEVAVEELQRIVRGKPPLSPAIARRMLSHFKPAPVAGHASPPALPEAARLSLREMEVLSYLSKGFTLKEIANLMGIKWFTVNEHIQAIYLKLKLSSA